jgi:hypothetical protein
MKASTPALQRVLVLLGFLLVAVGQLAPLGFVSFSPHSYDFFWIVSALGYVLLGSASWAWLTALSRTREGGIGMRWVLRLVALACLVLGIAYVGLINEVIELHRQLHHAGLRRQLLSYGLPLVGFCVAAFGFGTAASTSEAGPSLKSPELDSNAL